MGILGKYKKHIGKMAEHSKNLVLLKLWLNEQLTLFFLFLIIFVVVPPPPWDRVKNGSDMY